MSNRNTLCQLRAQLLALDESLTSVANLVPSGNATYRINRAREMARAAERFLSEALKEQVSGLGDPLDLPPWPTAWGEALWLEAGTRPEWLGPDEWVGGREMIEGKPGFASVAYNRSWSRADYIRLRADHPRYAEHSEAGR